MRKSLKLQVEQSELREKLAAVLAKDELTGDERAALDKLTKRAGEIETELRAALTVEAAEDEAAGRETDAGAALTPEDRERLDLRAKASVGRYLAAALSGRMPAGAEAEYAAAEGVDSGIPLGLFEADPRCAAKPKVGAESRENRADAPTPIPATGTGINLTSIVPAIFNRSVAGGLNIEMPRVGTGAYGVPRVTTNLAGVEFKAAGDDTDSTAGAITVDQTTAHRISARMSIRMEDIANVGMPDFESALKANLTRVMSDVLDKAILNGDGTSDSIEGLRHGLTDPTTAAAVVTWNSGLRAVANLVDGTWALSLPDIRLLVGPNTYQLFETLFRDNGAGVEAEISLAAYLRAHAGGVRTNGQMPAVAAGGAPAHKQRAIAFRAGQPGVRTAVMPAWNSMAIEDPYTGAGRAERYFTMAALVGDVVVVNAGAYAELEFQVSS